MEMYKIVGFILIFAGCSGLGAWYSQQFRKQLKELKNMCRILELLMGQIRFGRCTLPECCLELAERVEEPYKSSFRAIYDRSCNSTGESFGQLSEAQLQQDLQALVADKTDKEVFISCFAGRGYEEDRMQIRIIEQSKQQLEERVQVLSGENATKCRLALSLGTMSGLLLIILFL